MNSNSDMMADCCSQLTCLTCRVIFATGELQRVHYRCDWHRYNLKRKVASLPPVSAEEFAKRLQAQRAQDEANNEQQRGHCKDCKKTFGCQQALENHFQSKKHKDQLKKTSAGESRTRKGVLRIRPPTTEKIEFPISAPTVPSDDDWEDVSMEELVDQVPGDQVPGDQVPGDQVPGDQVPGDQVPGDEVPGDANEAWETLMESDTSLPIEPRLEDCIPIHVCLFCNRKAVDYSTNLDHMAKAHSFFIPDPDYLVDVEGLLKYLGFKVGALKVCLLCDNDLKTPFRSSFAVQQHMLDKGHTAMYFDNSLEYSEYYDFSSSHPEGGNADDEFHPDLLQVNPDWSLQLPSGAFIGHRSLARYYRQNLPLQRAGASRSRGALVYQSYKALGWTGASTKEEAMAKARDQKFAQKLHRNSQLKLGVKANKLQHHFRQQVLF